MRSSSSARSVFTQRFRDRVHAGHPGTGQHSGDPGAAEDLAGQRGVLGVAVVDEEPDLREVSGVLQVHEQVADGLRDPGMCGVRGGAGNADAPAGVVDGGEDVLALSGEGGGPGEVHRQDRPGLGAREAGPCDRRPLRGRAGVIGGEDLPHGGGSDLDAGEGEFAVDAPVAPGGVPGCQAEDEAADRGESARTPRPSVHARAGVAVFHRVAMPSQHCVRADQEPEPAQRRAGQRHEERCGERPVPGPQLWALAAGLSLRDGELVAQGKDPGVLLTAGHRQ